MIDTKRVIAFTLIGVNLLLAGLGAFLVIHDVKHLMDGSQEVEANIADFGAVKGNAHFVTLALGLAMVALSVHNFVKIYLGASGKEPSGGKFERWNSRITETGRTIADLMKANRGKSGKN